METSGGKSKGRISLFKRIQNFIVHDVWSVNLDDYPPIRSRMIRYLRILLLAYRGFVEDRVLLRASALTYFSLMSIVPILAMAFGIAKGFGMDKYLEIQLRQSFQAQGEIMTQLIDFSNSLLQRTGGGILAGIGIVILFYSVFKVFNHIERSLNDLWNIKKTRPFSRKLSDYLALMLIAPILLIAASGANVFISTQLTRLSDKIEWMAYFSSTVLFILRFSPYFFTWLLLTIIYIAMPNTKVRVKSGIVAAILAGTVFNITQWIYIDFQVGVSRYNAIYGSFAALPLFLAWLQISWLIVLFGAELAFSHQNQNLYEFEKESENISDNSRKAMVIIILNRIIKQFIAGDKPLSSGELSKELKIPIRLVRELLQSLVECNILTQTITVQPKTYGFQPATCVDKLTIAYVYNAIEQSGTEIKLNNPQLDRIVGIHKVFMEKISELPENILIRDI